MRKRLLFNKGLYSSGVIYRLCMEPKKRQKKKMGVKKKMERRKVGKIVCPRCNSTWTRTNVKYEEHVCKHCGYKWKINLEAKLEWND